MKDGTCCFQIKQFLEFHPAINFQDNKGRTVLDCAQAFSLRETAAFLQEHGALASGADLYDDHDLRQELWRPKTEPCEWRYLLDLFAGGELSETCRRDVLEGLTMSARDPRSTLSAMLRLAGEA